MTRLGYLVLVGIWVGCGPSVEDQLEQLGNAGQDVAIQELLLQPKRSVGPLLQAMDDPRFERAHPVMAEVLVMLMLRIDDENLVGEIRRHLTSHPNPRVRGRIAYKLGMLKRAEFSDALMEVVRDTVSEPRFEALKTLNIISKKLPEGLGEELDELAQELARSEHNGVRLEAMLRLEVQVDAMLDEATQQVAKAQLAEAESLYAKALEYAPLSWKARYRQARFFMDNVEKERGLEKMLEIGAALSVPVLKQAPVIDDGRLDDPACGQATQAPFPFLGYRGQVLPADMESRVYVGRTKDDLYLGFYSYDAMPDSLLAEKTQRDDQVYLEDSVEIFLDANLDWRSYVQIIVNSVGTIFDAAHENGLRTQDRSWSVEMEVDTHIGADFWSLECRIPFAQKNLLAPKSGDVWGANFTRDFRDKAHSSQWVYTYGEYHQVGSFGLLLFE